MLRLLWQLSRKAFSKYTLLEYRLIGGSIEPLQDMFRPTLLALDVYRCSDSIVCFVDQKRKAFWSICVLYVEFSNFAKMCLRRFSHGCTYLQYVKRGDSWCTSTQKKHSLWNYCRSMSKSKLIGHSVSLNQRQI